MKTRLSLVSFIWAFAVVLVVATAGCGTLSRMGSQANKAKCLNNLKQLSQALKMYADDYDGVMPSSMQVRHSKTWSKSDSLTFCSTLGKFPPAGGVKRVTWPQIFYDYMKSPDIVFCPSDTVDGKDPQARPSYWYKLANDKAWYGVGCPKPRRKMGDYGYESDQVAFYEHLGWHVNDTSGLNNGVQINASYVDTHVETIVIRSATSGDPVDCAVNSDGEPMYYNTDGSTGNVDTGPARHTDPTRYYDSF